MKLHAWMILTILLTSFSAAQPAANQLAPALAPPSSPTPAATSLPASPAVSAAPTATDLEMREAWLAFLKKPTVDAKPDYLGAIITALSNMIAVVVAAVLAHYFIIEREKKNAEREDAREKERMAREDNREREKAAQEEQREREKAEREMHREHEKAARDAERETERIRTNALLEYSKNLMQMRQRHFDVFYSPLWALIQQSDGVTRKMKEQLALDNPAKYRWELGDEGTVSQLQVYHDGKWASFRLLDCIHELRSVPLYNGFIERILEIGHRMTELIQQGVPVIGDQSPPSIYVEYLAHYSILSAMHKSCAPDKLFPPGSQKAGYYPRGFNKEVERSYNRLRGMLAGYECKSEAVLNRLLEAEKHG